MKMNKWSAVLFTLVVTTFIACIKPRVELDDTAWGDKAYITSAVLFRYDTVRNQMGYDQPVTGYQNVAVATNTNLVSRENATLTIVAVRGTNIKQIGIRFSHFAKLIEPLNGAPQAGMVSDFSQGPYKYRLTSADGTVREWTLNISVAP